MSTFRHFPVWASADLALQEMYGLNNFQMGKAEPVFGSAVTIPLSVGTFGVTKSGREVPVLTDISTQQLPPTLINLAWHFGHMRWAMENVLKIMRERRGNVRDTYILDPKFFIAAEEYAKNDFIAKRVLPHRNALNACNHPLYFYCIPAKVVETDVISGKPMVKEGDYVLCVLPKSVAVARHYTLSEAEIKLLAPQTLWLIKANASRKLIRSGEDLVRLASEWVRYILPSTAGKWLDSIQVINPQLVTAPVRNALAPGT